MLCDLYKTNHYNARDARLQNISITSKKLKNNDILTIEYSKLTTNGTPTNFIKNIESIFNKNEELRTYTRDNKINPKQFHKFLEEHVEKFNNKLQISTTAIDDANKCGINESCDYIHYKPKKLSFNAKEDIRAVLFEFNPKITQDKNVPPFIIFIKMKTEFSANIVGSCIKLHQ